MIVHARGEATLLFLDGGMGGHGDDGQRGEAGVGTDFYRSLMAVHHRHLEVHQDDVERGWLRAVEQLLDGFLTVVSHVHCGPRAFEQFHGDLLVDLVVLSEKDAGAAQPVFRFTGHGFARRHAVTGLGEDVHERVHYHGLGHGLDEEAVKLEPLRFFTHLFAAKCRDEHDGGLFRQRLVALDEAAGLQAIHAGHPPIHKDDVERFSGILRLDGGDRLRPGCHGHDVIGDGSQRFGENLPRRGVVIHDQDA